MTRLTSARIEEHLAACPIRDFFSAHLEDDLQRVPHRQHETHEHGHGRQDDRYYYLAKLPEDFSIGENWAGLNAIGMAIRITEHDDGRTSDDVRYYIVSHYLSGQRFAGAARGHWGIENPLHWQLDVTFQEDQADSANGMPTPTSACCAARR